MFPVSTKVLLLIHNIVLLTINLSLMPVIGMSVLLLQTGLKLL